MNRGDLVPREGLLQFTYIQFVRKATKESAMNKNTFDKLTNMVSASDRSEMDRMAQVRVELAERERSPTGEFSESIL